MSCHRANTYWVMVLSLFVGIGCSASAAPLIATKPLLPQALYKPGEQITSLDELYTASTNCMKLSQLSGSFDTGRLKMDGWVHVAENPAQRPSDSEYILSNNAILMFVKPVDGLLTCRLIARLQDEATAPSLRSALLAKLGFAPLSLRKTTSRFLKRNPGLLPEQLMQYYENDQFIARFKIETAEGKVFGNIVFGPNI